MGRTTFGKGSVQTITPLTADTALKLTTSLYFTPSGASINHKGIAPDIELPRAEPGAAGTDGELAQALRELKSPTVMRGNGLTAGTTRGN